MIDWEEKIEEKLQEDEREDKPIVDNKIRASNSGYCLRQMFLNKTNVKEFSTYVLGAMQTGTLIHEWMEEQFQDLEGVEFEEPVKFEEDGIMFKGRYDSFDGETVYDFKSQNGLSYVEDEPKDQHVDQLHVYMKGLEVENGSIVYIDKGAMEVEQHEVRFDDMVWDDIKARSKAVTNAYQQEGVPQSEEEIPFDPCDCFYCGVEDIDFEDGEMM